MAVTHHVMDNKSILPHTKMIRLIMLELAIE
jgi:hypothetical protein